MKSRHSGYHQEKYLIDERSGDRLILAAFVLGVHVREDIDSHKIAKHSPFEIAESANRKLLRNRYCRVEERDVVEVFEILLDLLE